MFTNLFTNPKKEEESMDGLRERKEKRSLRYLHKIVKRALEGANCGPEGFARGLDYVIKNYSGNDLDRALAFWHYIRAAASLYDATIRRAALLEYFEHKNYFIQTVAMVEILPTSVWRRILWRHNIFFGSPRGFLEELRPKDQQVIQSNAHDFIHGRTPGVITWFERVFKKMTFENLLTEDYDPDKRFVNKGAWSFNLAGLDFGFNCFAKTDKGKKIRFEPKTWGEFLWQVPRFFSLKNHEDDFIVNKEFGKYWWLYRTARSNYGYKRNRVVTLKKQICPGFWWTLIVVHNLFWILSPAAIATLFSGVLSGEGFASAAARWLCWPLALIMPLWIFSALTQSILRRVLPEKTKERFRECLFVADEGICDWVGQHKKTIKKTWKAFENTVLVLGLAFILSICFFVARGIFGNVGAILLLAPIYSVLVQKKLWGRDPDDFPAWSLYLHIGTLVAAVLCLIVRQFVYVKAFLIAIWTVLTALGIVSVSFFVLFAVTIALLILLSREPKNERLKKCQDFALSVFFWIGAASLAFVPVLAVGAFFYEGYGRMIIALIFYAALTFMFYFFLLLNDKHISQCQYAVSGNLREGYSRAFMRRLIKKNPHLRGLSEEERVRFLDRVSHLVSRVARYRDEDKVFRFIISRGTEDSLAELESKISLLGRGDYFLFLLEHYFQHKDFEKAAEWAAKKYAEMIEGLEKKAARRKKTKSRLLIPLWPFIKMGQGIARVWDFLRGITWLGNKLNERCPYIAESRVLDIDEMI